MEDGRCRIMSGAGLVAGGGKPGVRSLESNVQSRRLSRAESEADDKMGAGFALPDIGATEAGLRLRPKQPDTHRIYWLRQSAAAHDNVHLPEAIGGDLKLICLPGVIRVQVAEVTGLSALGEFVRVRDLRRHHPRIQFNASQTAGVAQHAGYQRQNGEDSHEEYPAGDHDLHQGEGSPRSAERRRGGRWRPGAD